MDLKRKWRRRAEFGAAVVVWLCAAVVTVRVLAGLGLGFRESFETIEPGMDEVQVIERLGEPHERSAEFRLAQYEGFEHEYARAAASGSKQYLRWRKGIDVVYAIGIDGNGKVTLKAVGGT